MNIDLTHSTLIIHSLIVVDAFSVKIETEKIDNILNWFQTTRLVDHQQQSQQKNENYVSIVMKKQTYNNLLIKTMNEQMNWWTNEQMNTYTYMYL